MAQIAQSIGLLVTGGIAIFFAVLALRVIFGNKAEYDRNRRRAGTFMQNLKGQLPLTADGTRDARIAVGLAVDCKTNTWIEQGKLSAEAVADALRRPQ